MSSTGNHAAHAPRPASQQERSAMLELVTRHDEAKSALDYDLLMQTFHPNATCELKPAGLRITSLRTLAEMYRRTLPGLSAAFAARRKAREWSNQNGLVREWLYPVKLSSGQEYLSRQLEIFEFAEGLKLIRSYRVRMNSTYAGYFARALGADYVALSGVERIPG